jgi:hypothetical protein
MFMGMMHSRRGAGPTRIKPELALVYCHFDRREKSCASELKFQDMWISHVRSK